MGGVEEEGGETREGGGGDDSDVLRQVPGSTIAVQLAGVAAALQPAMAKVNVAMNAESNMQRAAHRGRSIVSRVEGRKALGGGRVVSSA